MKTGTSNHTQSRYNVIAPLYDFMEWPIEQLWYKKWRPQLWNDIDGSNILEIGVGTGKNIAYYPPEKEITAIDLSPGMLKRAKDLLPANMKSQASLQQMDAQQLTLPDNYFDDIVATFVFCSVPNPVQGLKEALRVTKAGGKLHLIEHTRSDNQLLGPLMDFLDPFIHYLVGVHVARNTVDNVKKAGWHINQVIELTAGGIFKRIEAVKPAN
ncbi:class I SAM-dependent methyltransferase [Fodinibius saliphilus]|uniref:class I SAM-dependent methyltransferase n=1 Tax=Fodinibius saliphilus TaxID=1920650 RepID=UPI0011094F88|nr:class I SAM-dependent methyltransferase [Fodinibius saliphilus]